MLSIARGVMDDRIIVDPWGCDVPVRGSEYRSIHADYRQPLFGERPYLALPIYALVVRFGRVRTTPNNGPIELAPGSHRMIRTEALSAVQVGEIRMQAIPLEIGDVLIRHPWTLHRGSPNHTRHLALWSACAMSAAGTRMTVATCDQPRASFENH